MSEPVMSDELVHEMQSDHRADVRDLARALLAARAEIEDIEREWESCCERERARWEAEKELRAETERLRMAVGLATTLAGGVVMDADNPLDMMEVIVAKVTSVRERYERELARVQPVVEAARRLLLPFAPPSEEECLDELRDAFTNLDNGKPPVEMDEDFVAMSDEDFEELLESMREARQIVRARVLAAKEKP